MLKQSLFIFCLTAAALGFGAGSVGLERLFEEKNRLWELTPDQFVRQCGGYGFSWTSREQNTLRYAGTRPDGLTLCGAKIYEVIADFKDRRLNRISVSIYNRGDAGKIEPEKFNRLLTGIREFLKKNFSAEKAEEEKKRIGDAKIYNILFSADNIAAKLRWSSGGKSGNYTDPEFLTLLIYPEVKDNGGTRVSAVKQALPDNVVQDGDGARYIPVPMVDQGNKSYCVVAVLERVLKYYGSDVDQHLLAELAQSSADKGTSLKELKNAMDAAAVKFGVKFKCFYENRDIANFGKFSRMFNLYNRMAKKAGRPRMDIKSFCVKENNTTYYDPVKMLHAMDPELLVELRKDKYRGEAKAFFREIEDNIAKGIPVVWCVELGLVKERENPQAAGGHTRLIVGCNPAKEEMLYSDSWGRGHELKKMSYDEAWAISTAGFTLIPRYKQR